jgi:hypothetical protein
MSGQGLTCIIYAFDIYASTFRFLMFRSNAEVAAFQIYIGIGRCDVAGSCCATTRY